MGVIDNEHGLIKKEVFKKKKMELAPLDENPLAKEGYDLEGEDKKVIQDYFAKMRYGPLMSDVLLCKGHSCEHYKQCPLAKINKLPPDGSPCPVETELARQWCEDLAAELKVDSASIIDNAQIQSIVSNKLFIKRAKELLAKGSPVIKVFKSVALDGSPIFEPRLHPLHQALRDAHAMIDRDLNALIGTREAKSRDETRNVDAAERIADVLHRIEGMAPGGDVMGIQHQVKKKLKEMEEDG